MMMKKIAMASLAALLASQPAFAADALADDAGADDGASQGDQIIVTGVRNAKFAGTKTETPLIEIPQPISVVTSDQYLAQGAINISDTVKYAAGVTANPYGRDTRVDSFVIRGIDALQFRDGMRDIFSYYASISSDPYNFSRVEIVRGPASVLFGQGSIGGLVNLVSKTPDFETRGEISAVYGSYDRKELLGDFNLALSDTLAVRAVGRTRDSDTYVDNVRDDRTFFAPSFRWQPTPDTDVTLLGLYQKDKGGSTAQFLPIVGTFLPNGSNPPLDRYLFIGKPGWDRYDGRSLQGGGGIVQRFGDNIQLSVKARYIDADLEYFTHYPDSYSNPTNPYLDPARRLIGLYSDGSIAGTKVFSTDNNLQIKFNTGPSIEHTVLLGVDYSWNRVNKRGGFGYEVIDLYNINYAALTIPALDQYATVESQKQLGLYVQNQIRFFDRVSIVLGARRDHVTNNAGDKDNATTLRAGIIGDIGANISPFFSYTESFLPITGLKPQTGRQFEAGAKWQPDPNTLVTVTLFHIEESNRPITGPGLIVTQSGKLTTKGIEVEASRTLPGNFELLLNYGYNKLISNDSPYFIFMPRQNASMWSTKTFGMPGGAQLRLGAGAVYTGKRNSVGPVWTIVTPSNTTVDGLAEISWEQWRFSVNATNLLNKKYYASCLDRGDCFLGAPRNVMASIGYRF